MEDYFSGPERLEDFAPLGKKMRMGDPQELNVSDYDRLAEAISGRDFSKALEYLQLIETANNGMFSMLYQWAARFHLSLSKRAGATRYQELTGKIFDHFKKSCGSLATCEDSSSSLEHSVKYFAPEVMNAEKALELDRQLKAEQETIIDQLTRPFREQREVIKELLEAQDHEKAAQAFTSYYTSARTLHDCTVQYTDSFPTVVDLQEGQELATQIVDESFQEALFYTPMWDFAASLSPKQLAAFLFEHIRDHFSGPERNGSSLLVEHEDRYQMIFDSCGSGGALRRRHGGEQHKLKKAEPSTFSRAGEVPAYCTHCAQNAMTSIKRFGFPIYVTEFDPDPAKPCGWTVYKDPDQIPAKYFEEVGATPDPANFKRNYWQQD